MNLAVFGAPDGALDVQLLGDLAHSWIFHNLFTIFGVFTLLCIRRTFLGAVARPRQHPAAFRGDQRPSRGGEAARRGESFGDCEKQVWPGASTGRCDGFLMAFAYCTYLIISYHIISNYTIYLLYIFIYYFVAAVSFVEHSDFPWSGGHQGVLGSSGTRVVWLKVIGDAETQYAFGQAFYDIIRHPKDTALLEIMEAALDEVSMDGDSLNVC